MVTCAVPESLQSGNLMDSQVHIQLDLMTRQCARPYKESSAFSHNHTSMQCHITRVGTNFSWATVTEIKLICNRIQMHETN